VPGADVDARVTSDGEVVELVETSGARPAGSAHHDW
jgi:hypothetical protein